MSETRVCSRCVMDSSVPEIRFDAEGHCNYCRLHDNMEVAHGHRRGTIDELFNHIRESAKTLPYDCVVGLSGGTDSTYCLYVAKQQGLRPLAVHFNNGWTSDAARANIEAATTTLGVDLRIVTVNWEALRNGYRACLGASTPDLCMPCEMGGLSALYSVAAEAGIRYIILGLSYRTEGINPMAWHYGDGRYYSDVLRRFSSGPEESNLYGHVKFLSLARHLLLGGIRTIQLPLYMDEYCEQDIRALLTRELGWIYGGHHHFDCTYKPFTAYIQANKFGADLRKVSLSAQVRTGELSRAEALSALQEPTGASDAQIDYCLERLEMSRTDLEAILKAPPKSFRDYRTYYSVARRIKLPLRAMSRLGMLPETTYEKLFET